ncbi:glycosyltransferase family 2 protein [Geomonas silvestris]|uniref:glycosyltransferase family 2 protein n=1 Tax=Geomonas silvestris TaxID=2740184 RepID=UPI00161A9AA9|nr:glycosyltransferase [Geomonas silvestris]
MVVSGTGTRMSVVIPTWQRQTQLNALLRSLGQQLRLPDEVVVVCRENDTGSIEAVTAWAQSAEPPLPCKLLTVQREGHLPPLVAALEHCDGDIFCLIDDDAIPRKDWLLRLEEDFRDPRVGGIGGTVVNHLEDTTPATACGRPEFEAPGRLSWFGRSGDCGSVVGNRNLVEADCFIGCNMAFRRIALLDSFDLVLNCGSAISYETDVALNVKKKGFRLFYDPNSIVDHYLTPRKIDSKRGWNQGECFVYAHNLTYICLKHLSWYGKLGFAFYFFLGGAWGCPGPGTFVLSFLTGRPASLREHFIPAMKGRISGVISYYRNKRRIRG